MSSADVSWFDKLKTTTHFAELEKQPVAYFSAEYALWSEAPLYAGGLGVLAGDYLNEMSDRGFPYVALGLCYWSTYGTPSDNRSNKWPLEFGFNLVCGEDGSPIITSIPIDGRDVSFQAWRWGRGSGSLYLFDTRVQLNSIEDQSICDILYTEDRDMRLRQEILLGIGGMRFLRSLGIHPSIYHLNEGHSAFLALELIAHEMRHKQVDSHIALRYAKEHIVFTNHTLVPAGNEIFATDVVQRMLKGFNDVSGISDANLLEAGYIEEGKLFSMTRFGLSMSTKINAVSQMHAKKATEEWGSGDVQAVTNGIHIESWDRSADPGSDIWKIHQENKAKLIQIIKDKTGRQFHQDILLLGWARRLVSYKQPLAIIADLKRFKDIATKEGKRVAIVFAGPLVGGTSHYNEFLDRLIALADKELEGILVFLPGYDLNLAKAMTSGCDIWLNTPIIGSEACGTSSMKAALNGSLSLTTNDGWVPEAGLEDIGWVINDMDSTKGLLDVLESSIIPLYYSDDKSNASSGWVSRMHKSRELIKDKFSATRALRQYIEEIYIPVLKDKKHK